MWLHACEVTHINFGLHIRTDHGGCNTGIISFHTPRLTLPRFHIIHPLCLPHPPPSSLILHISCPPPPFVRPSSYSSSFSIFLHLHFHQSASTSVVSHLLLTIPSPSTSAILHLPTLPRLLTCLHSVIWTGQQYHFNYHHVLWSVGKSVSICWTNHWLVQDSG